jgi:antitoxin component of RelBE/YafQ-DinJ toxin-antitoxin module
MHETSDQVIRVTITLNGNVYDEIKRISRQMGLRPSTWISMVCTSKANNVNLRIAPEIFEQM